MLITLLRLAEAARDRVVQLLVQVVATQCFHQLPQTAEAAVVLVTHTQPTRLLEGQAVEALTTHPLAQGIRHQHLRHRAIMAGRELTQIHTLAAVVAAELVRQVATLLQAQQQTQWAALDL